MKKLISFMMLLSLTACQSPREAVEEYLSSEEGQEFLDERFDEFMVNRGDVHVNQSLKRIIKEKQAKNFDDFDLESALANRIEVPTEGFPSRGPIDAPVTIVEFTDFQSPYTRESRQRVNVFLKENQLENKVRWVVRNYAIPVNNRARETAVASLAAHRQGKFWEFTDLALANQFHLTDENFLKWAKELGMNVEQFKTDLKDPQLKVAVDKDREFALSVSAAGAPNYFINGVLLRGMPQPLRFKEVVDSLIHEKETKSN